MTDPSHSDDARVTGDSLPEDEYTLTLFSRREGFEDVVGNDLDGEPIAFPIPPNLSGDGVEGGKERPVRFPGGFGAFSRGR